MNILSDAVLEEHIAGHGGPVHACQAPRRQSGNARTSTPCRRFQLMDGRLLSTGLLYR